MPDMLVRLYDLPDAAPYDRRAEEVGITVRRAQPWDRSAVRAFIEEHFSKRWADEAELTFARQPISLFVAAAGEETIGFAAYEVSTRDYFGPTGVREDWRGRGIGAALLFRCLAAMRELGYAYAVIGGVGPAEFYEKVCGAFVIPGSETGIYG
ncbi:MAG: GNAT family N-acetyltransferase [Chloroflexi bacterium]|nr:GNAT family N-acetyltransferase [Chloroflexota bacterium]